MGPASEAGIEAGWRLVALDGVPVATVKEYSDTIAQSREKGWGAASYPICCTFSHNEEGVAELAHLIGKKGVKLSRHGAEGDAAATAKKKGGKGRRRHDKHGGGGDGFDDGAKAGSWSGNSGGSSGKTSSKKSKSGSRAGGNTTRQKWGTGKTTRPNGNGTGPSAEPGAGKARGGRRQRREAE